MKTVILILWFLMICVYSFGQWQTNGANIYFNNGKVGIGTNDPLTPLHIKSNQASNYLTIDHTSNGANGSSTIDMRDLSFPGSRGVISILSDTHQYGGQLYMENMYKGTKVGVLTLSELGNVGIGNWGIRPYAKLQVEDGDIYIANINKGIIMKSPDGQCWRGTLNNSGELIFTSINCPSSKTTSALLIESYDNIEIYPNPTNNMLRINLSNHTISEIYNLTGGLVLNQINEENAFNIDLSILTPGTYILKLKDENKNIFNSKKIIKL